MGADAELIRAAGRMGPKQWDYSGIMQAIAALGKFALEKKKIASELTQSAEEDFQIEEMPSEILNGPFAEQNSSFFVNLKNTYAAMVDEIEKPFNLPGSKKYKQAVSTINQIQGALEKNKSDLETWAKIRKTVNENYANMSKGVSRDVFHRITDLKINNTYGDMNAASVFTLDGLKIYASDESLMQNREFSPSELMEGFFINQMSIDNNAKNLTNILNKVGETRKNQGKGWNEDIAKTEIINFVDSMKKAKYGGFGIKSLAFDYSNSLGGGTFVQANKSLFSNPEKTNDEANLSYVEEYKKANPDATSEEIELAYTHQAADVWSGGDASKYEVELVDWLVGVAKKGYDQTERISSSDRTSVMLPISRRLTIEDEPGLVNKMKGNESESRTFNIQDITFDYKDGKWRSNFNGTMMPVEGNDADAKDGSGRALYNQLGQREAFKFLLLPTYNK